jgi:glyoxylase-like metal-dependent hydrolase (beta-lactamase superfamily II)
MVRTVIFFCCILLGLISCGPSSSTIDKDDDTRIFRFEKGFVNVFLVQKKGRLIMIDAGYAKHAEDLEDKIRSAGLDPGKIEYIIVTHGHPDHAGGAAYFKDKFGCKIVCGSGDKELIEDGKTDPVCPTSFMARMMKGSVDPEYPKVEVDIAVKKNAPFLLTHWDMEIEVIPGHTAGSLVVHFEDMVFVGDLIRGGGPFSPEAPKRHYFMCDVEDNDRDIAYMLRTSKAKTWWTGHFGPLSSEDVGDWLSER